MEYDDGVVVQYHQQKNFSDNPMNLITITDGVVVFFIAVAITLCEAIQELLTIFQKGVFVNQREVLLKKNNKELKAMLVGVKSLSSKNKKQLVDLVLIHC